MSGINAAGAENLNFALPINYVRGQLALAASNPLQPLAEVQETISAERAGSSTQGPDLSLDPTYGDVNLDEGFLPDPHEVSLTAGGDIEVDVGSCSYGYVAEPPDVDFYYTTSGDADLYVYVNGAEDTTLLVNRPDGSWVCDDDGLGDSNPVLVIPAAAGGLYNIWVGTSTAPPTRARPSISPR